MNKDINIVEATKHYLYAALWTEEMEGDHDTTDFLPSAVGEASKDLQEFIHKAGDLLEPYVELFGTRASSQLGHDLWLSRNGHGAGFFDHRLNGTEMELQKIARGFPERHVFVTDEDEKKVMIE